MGTKSFGKGSVQTIIPVAGGGAIRMTTARYYTPSGRSIQALGIEPDIAVEQEKLEKVASGPGIHEADLKGALVNETVKQTTTTTTTVMTKGAKTPPPDTIDDEDGDDTADAAPVDKGKSKKDEKPFDYQLSRAIDLIHGLHIFQNQKS
jgi:carboxyl-terminal processing protease